MAPPLGSLLYLATGHNGVPGLAASTEHWGAWHWPTLQYLPWRVGGLGNGEPQICGKVWGGGVAWLGRVW